MAVGTSGHKFKNTTPPVGLMMAELIDAVENGPDHDPTRFTTKPATPAWS